MSTSTVDEFLHDNTSASGELSDEQMMQLEQLLNQGDTDALSPETTTAPEVVTEHQPADDTLTHNTDDLTPENAAVLAKDGKTLIPYGALSDSRKEASNLRSEVAIRDQAIADLQQQLQQAQVRKEQGHAPTQADLQAQEAASAAVESGELDASVFGDMDEDGMFSGTSRIANTAAVREASRVEKRLATELEELKKMLAPLQAQQQADADAAHMNQIRAKHPDADSIAGGSELDAWIESQPSFVRAHYARVVEVGSSNEVIELLDAFKSSTGRTQVGSATDERAAAKNIIDNAKRPAPASLSEVPGGKTRPTDQFEQIRSMSPDDRAGAIAAMTPAQVEAYFSREM